MRAVCHSASNTICSLTSFEIWSAESKEQGKYVLRIICTYLNDLPDAATKPAKISMINTVQWDV